VLGLSVASLFGYRSGSIKISPKAWSKLERAERAAGVGTAPEKPSNPADSPSAAPPRPVPGSPTFYHDVLRELLPKLGSSELMELAETLHREKPPGWEPLASQAITLLRQKSPPNT
jgi:hypothetical protein